MSLETINALTQAGIGALTIILMIVFVWRIPQNAEAIRAIVEQIKSAAEMGVGRVEGANAVLMEAVKMLQETSTAAIESRNRLEHKYEIVQADLAAVKRDFEQQLAAKEAEIEALRAEIKILKESDMAKTQTIAELRQSDTDKNKTIEILQRDLKKALEEKDAIEKRLKLVEQAQESKPDETTSKAA